MWVRFLRSIRYLIFRNVFLKYLLLILLSTSFIVLWISWTESFKSKQPKNHQSNTKVILIWNICFDKPYCSLGSGVNPFINHCPVFDCYLTNDHNFMPIDQFDALIFHGPEFHPIFSLNYPSKRSEHQRYIYLSHETPIKYPVSHNLDGFFNLTMTYRFDSDVPNFYFEIADKNGIRVSPDDNPPWIKPDLSDSNLANLWDLRGVKKKAIAWFASNCESDNGRENYVKSLQKFIPVDIYGKCGPLICPRSNENACLEMLRKDYFFYIAFENGNCLDYVTEKAPKVMTKSVVPIVLGGANYTKFLPPHSYIDASSVSPEDLANKIYATISSRRSYIEYFWWTNYYKFRDVQQSPCRLCEVLHNDKISKKSYDIVDWWEGTKIDPYCEPISH